MGLAPAYQKYLKKNNLHEKEKDPTPNDIPIQFFIYHQADYLHLIKHLYPTY